METKEVLDALQTELRAFIARADEEKRTLGTTQAETKSAIDTLISRVDALDRKLARPDGGERKEDLADVLKKRGDEIKSLGRNRGRLVMEFDSLDALAAKTINPITIGTIATPQVAMPDRIPGIVPLPQMRLTMRDLLPSVPTASPAVFYVKEKTFTNNASPQVEAQAKAESTMEFDVVAATVRTIAHFMKVSRQALDDIEGLQATIRQKLIYGLKYKEELEILSGDNTGEHLDGLITQATAFDTSLLNVSDGWEKLDVLRRVIQQVDAASEMPTDFFVLNTADWADIELAKDTTGRYMIGDPRGGLLGPSAWGKVVIPTNAVASGQFLAGPRNEAQIRDRMGVTVEISSEDSDNFQKNLVTIRAEERLVLVVFRPGAFITGTLTTSPA